MRSPASLFLVSTSLTVLAFSCAHQAPVETPPPAPPPVRIPEGCQADLSGQYVHALNAAFRYSAQDDGETLRLHVSRVSPDAGLSASAEDGGSPRISLERTPRGFVGITQAVGYAPSGRTCPLRFPTEVTACSDGGITLRSAANAAVDEACRSPTGGAAPQMVEHPLLRQ